MVGDLRSENPTTLVCVTAVNELSSNAQPSLGRCRLSICDRLQCVSNQRHANGHKQEIWTAWTPVHGARNARASEWKCTGVQDRDDRHAKDC